MELLKQILSYEPVRLTLESLLKLGLAVLLSGIIGFEREHSHRPAGFRTHILVAVGSALIMMSAVYAAKEYDMARIDITRMSASVVSGIGFLGAGTILREGFTVKGLTTAASLWAVSCVGTAVGIGFYEGAIVATVVIYITLNSLKKIIVNGNTGKVIYIEAKHLAREVPDIARIIKQAGATIHSIEILDDEERAILKKNKDTSTIKALIFPKTENSIDEIIALLKADDNILDVYVD